MKTFLFFLLSMLCVPSALWAQGVKLPSMIAKEFLQSSSRAVSSLPKGNRWAAVSSARLNHLRALERDEFADLDKMLVDYFTLNPQAARPQTLAEQEQLQKALVKKWLERDFYASSRGEFLKKHIQGKAFIGKIDYLDLIPYDSRLVLLGEVHEEKWMVNQIETAILQFKWAHPDKNIYYASEFVDAVPGEELYFLANERDVKKFVIKRPYYQNITSRMIAAGVRVVGLENPELSQELLKTKNGPNFGNTALAWKTISLPGMKARNAYWSKIIRRIYQEDPDAMVFVHAGLGHTNYNQPYAVPWLLKEFKPFVVEYSAPGVGDFNTLLERYMPISPDMMRQMLEDYKKDPIRPVFFVRQMTSKRSSLVGGCDLHIKRIFPQ